MPAALAISRSCPAVPPPAAGRLHPAPRDKGRNLRSGATASARLRPRWRSALKRPARAGRGAVTGNASKIEHGAPRGRVKLHQGSSERGQKAVRTGFVCREECAQLSPRLRDGATRVTATMGGQTQPARSPSAATSLSRPNFVQGMYA